MLIDAKFNSIIGMYDRALVEEVGHCGHSWKGVSCFQLFSHPLCFHGCRELSGSNPSWLLCKNALLHYRPENNGPSSLLVNPWKLWAWINAHAFKQFLGGMLTQQQNQTHRESRGMNPQACLSTSHLYVSSGGGVGEQTQSLKLSKCFPTDLQS